MDRTDQTVSAEEIVSAAIAGDEPAFTALAERHLNLAEHRFGA